jgi:hypothetical protein
MLLEPPRASRFARPATMPQPPPIPREPRHAPLVLSAGAIEVVFEWTADRWAHMLLLDGEPVWESIDGPWPAGGDPRWPASPVLVELDRVGSGPAAAVVGVGLAGRSHFSASVSRVTAMPGADGVANGSPSGERSTSDREEPSFDVLFEVACRMHEQPAWLGSSYGPRHPDAAERLPLVAVSGCLLLPAESREQPADSGRAAVATAGLRRLRALVAADAAPGIGPVTIGWSYRIGRPARGGAAGTGPA